ncbi:hypothetical protein VHEMI01434 [[Torrubiella] hemipterigena]|uniref:Uncharacterized protein n=1 Tax=[Torrubiella] hemipterigena TaxID=1531966 RepID=A0A0A1SLX0_9HYPO|nr:hypothetical protein VHEMI01434 [[Torrubiella] hemipterigena]
MGWEVTRDTWSGTISLIAKVQIHHQQICGLAWSSSGKFFTTGGNDNYCCLFEANNILRQFQGHGRDSALDLGDPEEDYCRQTSRWQRQSSNETVVRHVQSGEYHDESTGSPSTSRPDPLWIYRWRHLAAIKAIAFHPWTDDVVATGGGLNDKCIHFFNTRSGATITTIAVAAQVTSLIWSPNGREIAATFGFSSQQRMYRVAVFGWPSCRLVTAVHWDRPCRIVHAIPYPRVPESRRSTAISLAKEGCILLAASDETLTFFELWTKGLKAMKYGRGHGYRHNDLLGSESSLDEKADVIR